MAQNTPKHVVVQLDCLIDATGNPTDCHVVSNTGPEEFADVALRSASEGKIKFKAASEHGIPVARRHLFKLTFALDAPGIV